MSRTTASTSTETIAPHPLARWLGTVRRRVLLHRRGLAAILAGAAVLLSLQAARAPGPPLVPVWAASQDLAAGQVLGRADLKEVDYRKGSVPDGVVHDLRPVLGRVLAGPVRRGEPVTDLRLVAPPLLGSFPSRVATPVRLSDPAVVSLLRVGDVVDLVAVDPQADATGDISGVARVHTISSGVTVIAIPRAGDGAADSVGALQGRLVLLAVPRDEAPVVAAAGAVDYLTALLSG